jgi:hypothetical protein
VSRRNIEKEVFCWKEVLLGRSFKELCAGVLLLEESFTGREFCARGILLQD